MAQEKTRPYDWATSVEAARLCGVSVRIFNQWKHDGLLNVVRHTTSSLGTQWNLDDLESIMAEKAKRYGVKHVKLTKNDLQAINFRRFEVSPFVETTPALHRYLNAKQKWLEGGDFDLEAES